MTYINLSILSDKYQTTYVAILILALLTPLFREAGVTPWSHEIDFLEPCPSAITSLHVLCSLRNHLTLLDV